MLEKLFEPLWRIQTCHGPDIGSMTCYDEATSWFTTPISILVISSFVLAIIGIEAFKEHKKKKSLEDLR